MSYRAKVLQKLEVPEIDTGKKERIKKAKKDFWFFCS
jgi:hypothetical protein